ncbi:cytidine deaminase [Nonlabens sp. YIK11]|uniref:cytidine deaminase n=1 Tax=Nonlabens sp. YIK11 TaxID=1453349 RepID=UPI0006DC7FDD|nr:cytidine deaminase [Nonlabens sp. YIK11]KQC31899.1 cytidine deaminase [Nonlabens sp. YIK11]
MKQITINTVIDVYDDLKELDPEAQKLMEQAIEARSNAYAPYSKFTVGCSLLLENGEIIKGNNQENAAYPSGLCAERVAIFAAGANYPGVSITRMAITASPVDDSFAKPVPPCGACRQSIAEYESRQQQPIEIFFMGASGTVARSNSLADLLPLIFDRNYL